MAGFVDQQVLVEVVETKTCLRSRRCLAVFHISIKKLLAQSAGQFVLPMDQTIFVYAVFRSTSARYPALP